MKSPSTIHEIADPKIHLRPLTVRERKHLLEDCTGEQFVTDIPFLCLVNPDGSQLLKDKDELLDLPSQIVDEAFKKGMSISGMFLKDNPEDESKKNSP